MTAPSWPTCKAHTCLSARSMSCKATYIMLMPQQNMRGLCIPGPVDVDHLVRASTDNKASKSQSTRMDKVFIPSG